MTRRRLVAFAAVAVVALVAAAAAGSASTAKVVQLRLHDGFVVKNTHILCADVVSESLIPKTKVIACEFASRTGAVPKTYEVALGVNGEVALARVNKGGPASVVFRRKLSVVGAAAPKLYDLVSGDGVTVKGTALTCATTGKKTAKANTIVVTCFKLDLATGKARANSYGFGITDGGAFVVHFDAKAKATPVKVVQHGK